MDLRLQGHKALITGASRGIGRAIAAELVREGASVAICARQAEALDQASARDGSDSGVRGHLRISISLA